MIITEFSFHCNKKIRTSNDFNKNMIYLGRRTVRCLCASEQNISPEYFTQTVPNDEIRAFGTVYIYKSHYPIIIKLQ